MAADFPAGFIGGDHRTGADGGTQRVIGRLRLPRRAVDGVDQAAARDTQPEPVGEQLGDLAVGEPALFVEQDGQGHRLRSELDRRCANRVRGLQRMPTLHAPMTLRTATDSDVKLANHRSLHRQVFVKLRHDPLWLHAPVTVRTARGERCLVRLIDVRRHAATGASAVRGARFAAGPLRIRLRQAARKRRSESMRRPTRGFEILSQSFVVAPETVAFDLRPPQVFAQPFILTPQFFDDLLRVARRRRIAGGPRHANVMPDSRAEYKWKVRGPRR